MTTAANQNAMALDFPAAPTGKSGWPWENTLASPSKTNGERVSIVVPCYQGGDYLEESLRSLILQNHPDLEIIVMDGGSTDNTPEILAKYQPWIARMESKPDRGQSHAINKGLALATGDYFNWHNADDVLLPGSLRETLAGFETHPDAMYISRHRKLLHTDGREEEKPNRPRPGVVDIRRALISACPGAQPGGLMRMDAVREAGGVDESFKCCMDEELMMKLRMRGPGYYLDGPGILFRVHPGQQSTVLLDERIREKFLIIDRVYAAMPEDDPLRELRASSLVFASRHAAGLCERANHPLRAKAWKLRALAHRLAARAKGVEIEYL
ncbi:MAG: glycosyltransferase [Verrucomicrobia bacterium]|nr:glycosyltransferase [Verrucomicrobiota bacterium]MCH8514224.1 glycosyltransferase [Kiritimatiellia bacterium]